MHRIAVSMSLLACHGATTPPSDAAPQIDRPAVETPADETPADGDATPPNAPGPPTNGVDEVARLEGQPEAAIVAELGEPASKAEFAMGKCCTEFQIELYNTYPPGKGHDAVTIREWTWDYDGYSLTVWLHEKDGAWTSVDTCRYADGVEF